MIIKRVGPASCAKIAGVLYGFFGLIAGAFVSIAALAGGLAAQTNSSAGLSVLLGVGSIIFFPILYGVLGFVSTLIGAALYNLLAGIVGGIQVDIQ